MIANLSLNGYEKRTAASGAQDAGGAIAIVPSPSKTQCVFSRVHASGDDRRQSHAGQRDQTRERIGTRIDDLRYPNVSRHWGMGARAGTTKCP